MFFVDHQVFVCFISSFKIFFSSVFLLGQTESVIYIIMKQFLSLNDDQTFITLVRVSEPFGHDGNICVWLNKQNLKRY